MTYIVMNAPLNSNQPTIYVSDCGPVSIHVYVHHKSVFSQNC